jgi:hypothetical protein
MLARGEVTMFEIKEDDFDLCSGTYESIISHTQKPSPLATDFSEEERIVILVWYAMGVIDNGGFHYLFESALPGDPYYHFTLEAYKQIGCDSAVEAFEQALGLFPNRKPPTDDQQRIQQYEICPEDIRNAIDSRFWRGHNDIVKNLAKYIRANFEKLGGLLS